ncbi:unnamed protein product [Closterium sp. NIES-54]
MVHQVLQRFGFQFSLPQPTPLSTGHSLFAPPSDESVEPSGLYPELLGCLEYLMTCTRPDLPYPLSLLAHYVAPGKHQKRTAPHSSSFPPTTAPLQTLHMDVWGPTRVSGQGRKRYFLLVVDDYMRYTTVFPLRSKDQVVDVLIPWIRAVRLQLRERFGQDLPVLRLHSDRGGEFSSNHLRDFCRGEGILQSFTLPDSPERRIGLVMEVARTSMIHAAAPHFLWPFAVWYATHQLNLWPRVSLPETSPTLRWTGKVGDASVFPVWGSHAFVRDTSLHAIPFGPTPSGVSQVDPLPSIVPIDVAMDSGATRGAAFGGAASGGAEPGGAEPGSAESEGAGSGGAEPAGVESGGAESEGVEPGGSEFGGTEPRGTASSGSPAGALPRLSPRPKPLSPQQLIGGARVPARVGGTGGAAAAGPGGARTRGTGAAGTSSVGGAGAGIPTEPGAAGAGGAGARAGGAGGARAGGVGAVDPRAGGAGAGGAVFGGIGAGGTVRLRPYFLLQLQQKTGGLTERREPASRPTSPVFIGCRIPRPRPPPVPGTYAMALCPSSVPLRVPLLPPLESSLPTVPDCGFDLARAASPTFYHLLATVVTDPSFESTAMSALVAELLDFALAYRLDYATALVAESESASPSSVRGECALLTDVFEDKQEDFECLEVAVPRFASMLLAPKGDPDAPDIPTPRSYTEVNMGPFSSQWQAAMDAKMASCKSTGTYIDVVPPSRANIVDGMWIFRVKRPLGSLPTFKVRYVARGFSQRQGVDYFQTFSPTLKMTTLRVLLHVATQRDYELHSLDFSTAFLQGSLHEEIWLRRPPGFTRSFPAGTQWSLRRLVYGLHHAPREWQDTLRTTLAALGFAPSTADPSLFLRTDTSLLPFYVLVYLNDLVFATADSEAPTLVKSELQKRHTCTDLGELRSNLGLQITQDRARCTITLTQPHMVHQVLWRFGFKFSSPQPTPLSTSHSLSAPPLCESIELSGPYPELVGCLITLGMGLVLGGRGPVVLTGHVDASWVDNSATQQSSLLCDTIISIHVSEKRNEPPPSKIEALDGSNYEEWSGRMRSAFKRYKLLRLAMGEKKMSEEGDARDRWIEKNAVLYNLILQSVNNEMFQHIKDLVELDDSGPKAWKLLRDVIQPNTLPMVIVLEKELAALSMRPGDDVKPVLDKIKDTYARMAAAGSNVSQMQKCTKIISVLDNSRDNLIPTLNTQQDQWTSGYGSRFCRRNSAGVTRVVLLPTKLLRGMELQEAAEEEGEGEAEAVGEALAEGEAEVTITRGMGALVAGGAPEWRERAGAQGDGAHGKADPGMFLMVEEVKGSVDDVGSVGKVVMHPLTHWVID